MHSAIVHFLFSLLKCHSLRCRHGLISLYSPKIIHYYLCTLSRSFTAISVLFIPSTLADIARHRCTPTGTFLYVCLSNCLDVLVSIRFYIASLIIHSNLIRYGTMKIIVYNVVMIKFTPAILCIDVQVAPVRCFYDLHVSTRCCPTPKPMQSVLP
jgi:hypothetical protein